LTAHELLFRRKKIENFSRLEHSHPGLPIFDSTIVLPLIIN
jgi:hypothetical protein